MSYILSVLLIVCDLCGVSYRSGRRIFAAFKTVLGAKRISVGSVFDGKRNLVGSWWEKFIDCWNFDCLCERNE